MPFKTKSELRSRTDLAYRELERHEFLLPAHVWRDLKYYAEQNNTTAGEVVRNLLDEFLLAGRENES